MHFHEDNSQALVAKDYEELLNAAFGTGELVLGEHSGADPLSDAREYEELLNAAFGTGELAFSEYSSADSLCDE